VAKEEECGGRGQVGAGGGGRERGSARRARPAPRAGPALAFWAAAYATFAAAGRGLEKWASREPGRRRRAGPSPAAAQGPPDAKQCVWGCREGISEREREEWWERGSEVRGNMWSKAAFVVFSLLFLLSTTHPLTLSLCLSVYLSLCLSVYPPSTPTLSSKLPSSEREGGNNR
jgi:hypothetical protein